MADWEMLRERVAVLQFVCARQPAVARVDIPEHLRGWHCEHPIRGSHGYFAGCADGGAGNKAFHTKDVTKIGGLQHEAEIHHLLDTLEKRLKGVV